MRKAENVQKNTTKKIRKESAKKEWKDINGQKLWERTCPNCNSIVYHKNRGSWWVSRKNNTVCYSCKNSGSSNPFYGKHHSNEHRQYLSLKQTNLPHVYKSEKYNNVDQRTTRECFGCGITYNTTLTNTKRYCTIRCFNRSQSKKGIYSSYPERQFVQILKSKNILFEHQYEVEGKLFDFYIPDGNILIEIDGVYWHDRDGTRNTLMHQRIKQNDLLKNEIAQKHGFNLIRLWEDELENVSKYLH